MQTKEIKVGGIYSNGKKRESIRRVKKIHRNYLVDFEVLKGPYKGWDNLQILLYSFAKWADHEVEGEAAAAALGGKG